MTKFGCLKQKVAPNLIHFLSGLMIIVFFLPTHLISNQKVINDFYSKTVIQRDKEEIQEEKVKNEPQDNLSLSLPDAPSRKPKKIVRLTVTAYSSSRDETDEDPFTTASGSKVRDGIVACDFLPFGTKVRFPEVYGEKIFTVEDRIGRGNRYLVDIWKPSKSEAKNWGVKILKMEIL